HPYHTSKDLVIIVVFLIIFAAVVFFAPEMGGYFLEHANFDPADQLATPEHIAPVWYFTPFYAILRAVPDKLLGVILMGGAVMLPFFLPWLDRCRVKSVRYRSWIYKTALGLFAVSFIALGFLGMQTPTPAYTILSRVFSAIYFAFFILMPYYSSIETTKPVPTRVTK
ncbi:MAG: cytochrome b, partial [Gammaproteobacteria bacterium]|nr:cytochrome b [Gammaproteobacteria bacterium]